MAVITNDNGDDGLISQFGHFIVHEMTQEMVDRISWVLEDQQLDHIPSVRPLLFLQFAAVQFATSRIKVSLHSDCIALCRNNNLTVNLGNVEIQSFCCDIQISAIDLSIMFFVNERSALQTG